MATDPWDSDTLRKVASAANVARVNSVAIEKLREAASLQQQAIDAQQSQIDWLVRELAQAAQTLADTQAALADLQRRFSER